MPSKRYKPEKIIAKLRQVEVLLSQGKTTGEARRAIGIAERTYCRRRKDYAGHQSKFPTSTVPKTRTPKG